ncbi:hypothetical protein J2X36_002370 [Methylobacterium sp. BE186]|uniref:hypothetical protein n=1 Tax=Methylobacterium sp. BE186 TaxID=2817715 RepID=UPI00285AAF1E|nr:hypothetical protein [Methylobacterium sp. BE186]MDR7037623.1 hypothetical protein [Methylobacterium sp. BE186]
MAPGYVIATALETAGLITLAFGLLLLRAERSAKAAELKGFLRSGHPVRQAPRSLPVPPPPVREQVAPAASDDAPKAPSEARDALRRAYPDMPETRPAVPAAA